MTRAIRRTALIGLLLSTFLLFSPAFAQTVTSLSMTSSPGDYIGQGQTYFLTPTTGTFSAQVNGDGGVSISYQGFTPGDFWSLDFSAPNNVPLAQGTYLNATRFPFQAPGVPGFDVVGDGRGCNMDFGSFTVLQVVYGPSNTVTAFDATFTQYCESLSAAPLTGEIRYNANVPLAINAPTSLNAVENQPLSFTVSGIDAQSLRVVLTASNVPPGATFIDLGNSTGSFSWTPTSAQAGTYVVTFTGNDGAGNSAVVSTQIAVIPPPPSNDDILGATSIPTFPYSLSEDVSTASSAPSDPFCDGNAQSVWFTYTATSNERLEVNTFGSNFDTTVSVYTGAPGSLIQQGCNDDSNGTLQSRVDFDAIAGTTYYFMAAAPYRQSPANLVFNLQLAPPPFTFTPTVDQFGTVNPSTGNTTIQGAVSCNYNSFINISGQVKEMHGNVPVNGFFNAFVPCNATTANWSATLQSQLQLFHGRSALLFTAGKATVTATAFGFDFDTGEFKEVNITTTVTLSGH